MLPAALPTAQARWLDQLLGGPIPAETNATCHACAMVVDKSQGDGANDQGFNPEVKCCSFMPHLWNFLVGGVLEDDQADPVGRTSVEARIDRGVAVTPLGLGPTPLFD